MQVTVLTRGLQWNSKIETVRWDVEKVEWYVIMPLD